MPSLFIYLFAGFVVLVVLWVVTGFLFRGYRLKNANDTDFSSHYDSTTNTNL
jgi:hypothetical protein